MNGGRGIIIGKPAEESGRYPVLVYAKSKPSLSADNSDSEVLEMVDDLSGLKRSMKEQNLTPLDDQKCKIYQDYASMAWEYAYAKTDSIKDALFHLEHYTERWPEDYMCSITYANLIRDGISSSEGSMDLPTDKARNKQTFAAVAQGGRIKRPAEAWRILKRTEPFVDPDWEQINQFRYAMCVTACDSNQPSEIALNWALKMTAETNSDKEMKESALKDIIKRVRDNSNNADEEANNEKLQINKKVCYALLEMSPDSTDALTLVAGAECLVGNNEGGAKLYRQAMETGQFHGQDLCNLKENLALAQMQSPGGSLENYDVLNSKEGKFYTIHKKHAGKYAFGRNSMGMCYLQPNEGCGLTVADMLELIDIPDPDDESVFGSEK